MTSTMEETVQVGDYSPLPEPENKTVETPEDAPEQRLQEIIDGLVAQHEAAGAEQEKPVKLTAKQRGYVRLLDRTTKRVAKAIQSPRTKLSGYFAYNSEDSQIAFGASKGVQEMVEGAVEAAFGAGLISPPAVAYLAFIAGYFVGQQLPHEAKAIKGRK